ncbi:respiratory nitrate reductase subunit gamma [Streptomyces sp. NPDC088745]|uniref:respiratory nitrate reductase subunit gamma n=1 Tax=Streptomyces sp. NPDC088745 TaxID=3365884 RepID=UPI0037F2510D
MWRARHDQFGWTSHSSQLHESRLLRIGPPLFHFGMLFVVLGHVVGLLIPRSWTDAIGVSDHTYHLIAVTTGAVAGAAAAIGIGLLVHRRLTVPAVRRATLRSDRLMYASLLGAIVLGLLATVLNSTGTTNGYDYREGTSPWFRSLFTLAPDYALMAGAPLAFKLHVLFGFTFFALVPYSRLVHVFSAPVKYLFRPYAVCRGRDPHEAPAQRRGWERTR